MKKGLVVTLIVIGSLLVAIQLAVPPLAKNYINSHGPDLVGRRVEVGRLWVNIFTASLSVRDAVLYEADGTTPFVSVGAFDTRVRIFPLLGHRFIVRRVALDEVTANIRQLEDGTFNFDDIATRFAADSTGVSAPASKPWDVGIYNIGIRRSDLIYTDGAVGSNWDLRNLTLDIPGFYLSGESTDVGLKFDFPDGGSFATEVKYDVAGSRYTLALTLRDFSVESLLPYLHQTMNVSALSGLLCADIEVRGSTERVMDFNLGGTVSIRGFSLLDDREREVVRADSILARIFDLNLAKEEFLISEIGVHGIHSHYEIYADSTDCFARLMKETPAVAEAAPADASKRRLRIERFTVESGVVEFTDHTTPEKFHYRVGDITVHATDIDPSASYGFTARATLQNSGVLNVHWTGNPSDMSNHNLTIDLHNVDMSTFSPYTVALFGYPFARGTLSYRGQNIVRNNQLQGTNHIDIYRPELDKKRKDVKPQHKIPLRTGIYVLTDREGRMRMDVPVSGDVASPDFSYRHIITKALVNTMFKVVTSPAKYIAEMMGLGDKMDNIAIDLARNEFNSEQYDKFAQLATVLRDKPDLRLTLTQEFNYDEAIAIESLAALKRAYYLRINPAKAASTLEMLDSEAAIAIDAKSKGLASFADSLLKAGGKPSRGDLGAKARTLFGEAAETAVLERTVARNALLYSHFSTRLGLADTVVNIRSLPVDSLRTYKGKGARYNVALAMRGEAAYVPDPNIPVED